MANAFANLFVVAIAMNNVKYIDESQTVVAGPNAASCTTEDRFGDVAALDDVARVFPAYRPTAAESTRDSRGSDTHIRKVVATKNMILR